MSESKLSFSQQNWSNMSSINNSGAPGFIPVPCPSHQQYSITNICKSPKCIEPLCPQCIVDHVKLHEQTKQPAKIQNIITTRITCIEQLARLKYDASKQLQEAIKQSSGNIGEYIESHNKKLMTAHKKVQQMVDEYFQDLYKKMEVLMTNFQQEKTKKQNEAKVKFSPFQEYIKGIVEYKEELESEQYVPALIELLNDPPRKPKIEKVDSIDNLGGLQIGEKYFQEIKNNLNKFVKISLNFKDKRYGEIQKNKLINSNNMKFSRFDRSGSQDCTNRLLNTRNQSIYSSEENVEANRRSNSKKRIFGAQSIVSSVSINSQYGRPYNHL